VHYFYRIEPDGPETEVHLELNMFERAVLVDLFADAGFRIVWEASDFSGWPMVEDSVKWVLVLQAS
jgi:hypothetical protein